MCCLWEGEWSKGLSPAILLWAALMALCSVLPLASAACLVAFHKCMLLSVEREKIQPNKRANIRPRAPAPGAIGLHIIPALTSLNKQKSIFPWKYPQGKKKKSLETWSHSYEAIHTWVQEAWKLALMKQMAPSSSRVLAFLLSLLWGPGCRRVWCISSYSFNSTPAPVGRIETYGSAKGDIILFGVSVRLNQDFHPLLPDNFSIFLLLG